ncbi:MAG: retention module-containing protein, partial [Aeromonas sp.]
MRTQIIDKSVVISAIKGDVAIVLADGSSRPLQKGEILQPGAKVTLADDAKLAVTLFDDSPVANSPINDGSALPSASDRREGPPAEIAALQTSILQGVDPTKNFEAAAAGGDPAGGAGIGGVAGGSGNGGFVTIDRTAAQTIAAAGFDTGFEAITAINENQDDGLILANQLEDLSEVVIIQEGTISRGNVLANSTNPDGPSDTSIDSFDWGSNIGVPAGTTATIPGVGSLIINPDGSYTFTPVPNYSGLVPPISYTVTDGTDSVQSSLSITISPVDDPVRLGGLQQQGGELKLDEANLADGRDPNSGSLTQSGTFSFSASDGVQSLTLGGVQLIVNGQVISSLPLTITSPLGNLLSITAITYNSVTGEGQISYSYTLNDNETHTRPFNDAFLSETFSVVLTDLDGDKAEETLNVTILDDLPVLAGIEDGQAVSGLVHEDALSAGNSDAPQASQAIGVPGTLNSLVNFGADGIGGFALNSNIDALSAQNLTSGGVALSYRIDSSGKLIATAGVDGGIVFSLTVGEDGSYIFTLSGPLDHPQADGNDDETLPGVGIDFFGLLSATDGDGDPLQGGFAAGSFVINVQDDVPKIALKAVVDGDIVLTTQDADTIGATVSDSASASFAAAFLAAAVPSYGADGPGTTTVSGYNLSVTDLNSGLTS